VIDPGKISLDVSEVFYSPQGEGARAGEMSVFVRLQGCSAKMACFEAGVRCDTEFVSGKPMTLDEIKAEAEERLSVVGAVPLSRAGWKPWIIWTGGEPLDQLNPAVAGYFAHYGFRQAVETSGVRPFPVSFRKMFDWICCSPKVAEHVLAKHFGESGLTMLVPAARAPEDTFFHNVDAHVHELRYVRHTGQQLPQPTLRALTYFLSPHSDGNRLNKANIDHVIALCGQDPRWRISTQQHKQWGVL
jgi:7-carboxy-7-deazaguanine synthase